MIINDTWYSNSKNNVRMIMRFKSESCDRLDSMYDKNLAKQKLSKIRKQKLSIMIDSFQQFFVDYPDILVVFADKEREWREINKLDKEIANAEVMVISELCKRGVFASRSEVEQWPKWVAWKKSLQEELKNFA